MARFERGFSIYPLQAPNAGRFADEIDSARETPGDIFRGRSHVTFPQSSPKPNLSRFASRLLSVPPVKHQLEMKLLGWIGEIATHTKHPATIRGLPYERYLLCTADGIDDVLSAPAPMALSQGPGQQTVQAKFGFRQDIRRGDWYVEHIRFSVKLGDMQQKFLTDNTQAEELAGRKRILDAAEAEQKLHPKHMAFPLQDYADNLFALGNKGYDVIKANLPIIHWLARNEASIPDNPYTPKDVAMGLGGGFVEVLGKTSETAEVLAKGYDLTDKSISMVERFTSIGEDQEAMKKYKEDGNSVLRGGKSTGDVITKRIIDIAADMPGVGQFVKGFAGMFYDFASANFAGEVTKIRCRIYTWYITGFVSALTAVITELPVTKFDGKYYQLGISHAKPLPIDLRVGVQLALMDFYANHNITGGYGNKLRAKPLEWVRAEDYLAHWSPGLLADAMVCMLCQSPYLLD
jgi:hypothetical protein